MRLGLLLWWWLVCLLPWAVNAAPPIDLETALESIPAYAPDRILVRFKPGTAAASVADLHRQANGQRLKTSSAAHISGYPPKTANKPD